MKSKITQRKETKKTTKVRDLKPVKDAKGGLPPGPCGPKGVQSPKVQGSPAFPTPWHGRPDGNS